MKQGDAPNPEDGGGLPPAIPGRGDRGSSWLHGAGARSDVVLSSRVRLARNLAGFAFVPRASRAERREILTRARRTVLESDLGTGGDEKVIWVDLHETPALERQLLAERHLISTQHARGKLSTGEGGPDEPRGVAIRVPDESLSVMVNEEDHIRLQVIQPGLDLAGTFRLADEADDKLERSLDYAFNPRFGYLTACPTNVGTGARFSVMLHLPALRMTGEIDRVKHAADDMGLAVRGFYGEGSDTAGDFYQLSNQTTLGRSETVLLDEIEREIVPRVVDYERQARETLARSRRLATEDEVHRAIGTLRHARLLETQEAVKLLSVVRLGVVMGLIRGIEAGDVHGLLLQTHPAHLQRVLGRAMTQHERRSARADVMRERFAAVGS